MTASGGDLRAPALRPLDIAYGIPLGFVDKPPLVRSDRARSPRRALEDVLRAALSRSPCLVSFSGGRDSSALLAVAVDVARRENLDLPVPATLVFPKEAESDEAEYQVAVLQSLGIQDRVVIEIDDELDAVGEVATSLIRRHGVLWPFNTHFHQPIVERAAGGSVVTGFGGDELGRATASARAERWIAGRQGRRWRRDDILVAGLAVSPLPIRRLVHLRRSRRDVRDLPWLTGAGRKELARVHSASEAAIPLGWERKLRQWIWRSRYFEMCRDSFAVMGKDHDVDMYHPLVDERVLDALASYGGFAGLGSRAELMAELFGDLLPAKVITRESKAAFTNPLWTATARRFSQAWSGGGVDTRLVDPDALRRHWAGETRNLVSTTLLQVAWLHDNS